MVESGRIRFRGRSEYRRLHARRQLCKRCQFWKPRACNALRGPNFFWSDLYLTKWFALTKHLKLRIDAQFFNVFNHPNFSLPSNVIAGATGESFDADRVRRTDQYNVAADRTAGRWTGRR